MTRAKIWISLATTTVRSLERFKACQACSVTLNGLFAMRCPCCSEQTRYIFENKIVCQQKNIRGLVLAVLDLIGIQCIPFPLGQAMGTIAVSLLEAEALPPRTAAGYSIPLPPRQAATLHPPPLPRGQLRASPPRRLKRHRKRRQMHCRH